MSYEREPVEATVSELKPGMKSISIAFKVVDIGEAREVTSRRDGETHRVADATVGDSTGTVMMPLWDDSIDDMEVGKTYQLENGYTGLFKGNLRLNVGRYGKVVDAEEDIDEVDETVDMSEERHEDHRRRRGGGRRGGRSGGRGGRSGGYGGRDRRGGGYR